jgi:tetratricopeptide (TPR) repeat protein
MGLTVLLGVTALVWRARRGAPQLLVGWAWFVGMLIPVSGLVQVGQAAMADRYTYLPLIGLAVATAWSARDLVSRRPRLEKPGVVVAALLLFGLGVLSAAQLRTWRDGESLFRHALAVTENNAVAHTNLALVLGRSGRDLEAAEHLDAAVELSPGSAIAWGLRGELRVETASDAAALDLRTAIRLEPLSVRWRTGLGRALADSDAAQAEASLRAALAIDAAHAPAHAYLAALLQRQGRDADAASHYASALSNIDALERAHGPAGVARLHGQYAVLLQRMGRDGESVTAYESALARGERSPLLVNNLAWLLATGDASLRNPRRAVVLAEEAVAARRDDPRALDTLATALAAAGREAEARATAARALARAEATGESRLAASIRQRFPAAAP